METSVRRTGWVTLVGILFVIAGVWNVLLGLVGLGVSLGGTDESVLGELSFGTLEGLGIALLIVGAVQLFAGVGILQRAPSGRVVGLIVAVLTVLIDFGYYRVLEGWAFSGIVLNLLIILILSLRRQEFA